MTIRILIVDDHAVLRDGLRAMLETSDDIRVAAEAADGVEALANLDAVDPDVVLMDVRMPNQDGLATLRQMRRVRPQLPIVILSMYDDPAYVEEAIASGAAGYLLKTVTKDELIRAVRAAEAGQGYLQAEITRPVLGRFTRSQAGQSDAALSPRETEVLQQIANGLANKQIAVELGISETTVKTHIASLFEKLGASHRAHAVALALRQRLID